jgi:hypothetical protein
VVKKIRGTLGKMWKEVSAEERAVFENRCKEAKARNDSTMKVYEGLAREWDRRTWEVKAQWQAEGNTFEEFCRQKREEDERLGLVAST